MMFLQLLLKYLKIYGFICFVFSFIRMICKDDRILKQIFFSFLKIVFINDNIKLYIQYKLTLKKYKE